jgi:signal transduction histidine kinase
MQQARHLLDKLLLRESAFSSEPGQALFKGLRLRLALRYSAVLGGALLLFSLIIYFSVQYLLFSSVRDEMVNQAQMISMDAEHNPDGFCRSPFPSNRFQPPPPRSSSQNPAAKNRPPTNRLMYACFDKYGRLLQPDPTKPQSTQEPTSFLDNGLAKALMHGGDQTDIVDGGYFYGHIYRYALVVPDPNTHGSLGVIQVGESISPQEGALRILLSVLLISGGLILVCAIFGGLFLSRGAMAPARLAFVRQQNFIANASHELRTPLTFLCANTEILLEERERLSPDDVVLLEDIQTEAVHLAALANSMLTLARLDAGDLKLHREHDILDLTALAESVVRQGRALANQRNVRLQALLQYPQTDRHKEALNPFPLPATQRSVGYQEHPKPLYIIGDPLLLEQTVLVLLENAIKYNRPGGQVVLSTSLREGKACLEVQDTGIGIAPEHLPHLGERFYRVDKARSRSAGGNGLGLSIARGIVLAHGGSLQFASEPGLGTTATILLPAMNAPVHDKKGMSQMLA